MEPEDLYWIRIFVNRPDENTLAVEFYDMNENQTAIIIAMATKQMRGYEVHRMIKDNEWEPINKFQETN